MANAAANLTIIVITARRYQDSTQLEETVVREREREPAQTAATHFLSV